jgi:cytochrome P450
VRNDVVSLFAAGTGTAADALTWLWLVLDAHPQVAEQLYDEVDRVLDGNPPNYGHLQELRYTKMVIQEVLRLYSSGWIIPRMAAEADEIGGVRIPRHSTVLVSPYLTHRMERWWDDPGTFKPDRFLPERMEGKPRFAYIPFGGGPHLCLGNHFFQVEAQLIVATILSRFRPRLVSRPALTPRLGTTLRAPARLGMVLQNVNGV